MRIHLSPLHRDKKEGILLNEVFGVGKLSSYSNRSLLLQPRFAILPPSHPSVVREPYVP